jgi:tripartite-type tricarboxylate transporter receptor subunit TctC
MLQRVTFTDDPMGRNWLSTLILCLVAVTLAGCNAQSEYPGRPITMVVPWGAGGGTDAVARMIASLMERDLGQPVNVVNRTGGGGVVGHQAVAGAQPDGYTIGLITAEIGMMHWQGLTKLNYADYTPIALVNYDPAGVQVRADSPYKTLNDLLRDIGSRPGQIRATGCGQGCGWHIALAGLLQERGLDPKSVTWVPSNGAAPGLLDLVAGGVQIVPCSLPEARSLIESDRVRSLAIMHPERDGIFTGVPTLQEAIGSNWSYAAWRGIAAPKGLPKKIADRLATSVQKAYDSQEYKDFMRNRGFGMVWSGPAAFRDYMAKADAQMGETMKAIGMTK